MAPQEIFGAQEHIDKTEGRGGAKIVGWFTTRLEAERFSAEIPGVYGTRNTLPIVEGVLYDNAEEHPDFNAPEAIRQNRIRELETELAELRSQDPTKLS